MINQKEKYKNPGYRNTENFFGKNIKHKNFTVKGWTFNPIALDWYKNIIKSINNGTVVEVGVYGGASLLQIVDICKTNNTKIIGIDPWEMITNVNGQIVKNNELKKCHKNLYDARKNLENIVKLLNYDHVELIQGFSVEVSKKFKDNSIDLIYIDGNHSYDAVTNDIKNWIKKLKKECFLIGDDFGWKSVKSAVIDYCKLHKINFGKISNKWFIKT